MTITITIHASFLPHTDAEASLAFFRDVLGFEVRLDVGYGDMRWITVGPPGQPDTSIVLTPPAADPSISDAERAVIVDMIAKGTYASLLLATDDLDATFEKIEASNADIVQEPMEQQWGTRDCAVRDPAGNMVRIQQAG
ncbi:glyoxalase [Rhodococcoides trifolii]|uniref:Glyoxalase n=1 Tax=Rhodococcoides trifolii TaxID=908250 RepID=A0A917CNW2_9NOCA|nr:glyoxalase [Rhodococcus trifolii]